MALFLRMPLTFRVGDTAECRINMEPARVSWRYYDVGKFEWDLWLAVGGDGNVVHPLKPSPDQQAAIAMHGAADDADGRLRFQQRLAIHRLCLVQPREVRTRTHALG
jgi:hypothetical protein